LKCGCGISRDYWPIWVSVSVSELNQNDGFGRTLPTAKSSMKKASVKATYQKKIRLYYEQSVKDSFYEVDQDAQVGRFFTKETFAELSTKRILL
jgi:hypothetical protein